MATEVTARRKRAGGLFAKVPGMVQGGRVLVNFFGGKRMRMTLGFPTDLTKLELSRAFLDL